MYAAHYQTRYSGSVDQKLERDLGALDSVSPAEDLIAILREDHGDPNVSPDNLDTRGVGHPLYNMTVILIRAMGGVDWSNGLAMEKPVGKEFDIERHHIFPKSVLGEAGYETGKNLIHRKRVNEIANRVPLTKAANMDIFYKPPAEYLPMVREKNPGNLERFMIPEDERLWQVENYEEFLEERRRIIAGEINEFMRDLLRDPALPGRDDKRKSLNELLAEGENESVEFKSTLRWHMYAERMDKEIELSALKTIAAFLNTDGGTLLIGVDDDGVPIGVEKDQFEDEDKMMLHLTNRIRDWIGASYMRFVRQRFEKANGRHVLRVDCQPSVTPAYLEFGNDEHLYIRTGPSTVSLATSEIHEYVRDHFLTEMVAMR